jgi:HNH endonuclease
MPRHSIIPIQDRFWSKVDKNGTCWEWTASAQPSGYGQIQYRGTMCYVHRLSYEWAFGPILDGLFVCHHCDNKRCVRPDHLFLGTHADNMHDAQQKGRLNVPRNVPIGENNNRTRLTVAQVIEIRQRFIPGVTTLQSLADEYGVWKGTIRQIVTRKTWRHIS